MTSQEPGTGLERMENADQRWREEALPFVEKMGFHSESMGQPRMAGRVMAWLLVCEPPWQSIAEIALALQSSRSAVNAIVNRMVDIGMFERVPISGQRSNFYRFHNDGGERLFLKTILNLRAMRELAEEGLATLSWREPEKNRRLEELRAMHAFMETEMPRILERWKQHYKAGEKP